MGSLEILGRIAIVEELRDIACVWHLAEGCRGGISSSHARITERCHQSAVD
jgi:hypothetical protein